jgi:hypothetical protein
MQLRPRINSLAKKLFLRFILSTKYGVFRYVRNHDPEKSNYVPCYFCNDGGELIYNNGSHIE